MEDPILTAIDDVADQLEQLAIALETIKVAREAELEARRLN